MSIVRPIATFMNIPPAPLVGSSLAILGVPLDSGNHPLRGGSRLGPEAVRKQSRVLNRYSIDDDLDVLQVTGLFDAGDIEIQHGDIPASFSAIQSGVRSLLEKDLTVIAIGGDGSVTLPQLRAVSSRHPDMMVIHIDAHTDAYPFQGYYGATAFTRAAEEKLFDIDRSFHIGMRNPVSVGGLRKFATDLGYNVVSMRELRRMGMEKLVDHLKQVAGSRPVYLCYDVDVFEPSVVPGVFTPLCDGLLPHEGLELLRSLSDLNIVHFDINNVTPQYDVHEFTALLGAHIVWTCVDMTARATASSHK